MKYNIIQEKIVSYVNYITITTKFFTLTFNTTSNIEHVDDISKRDIIQIFKREVKQGIYYSDPDEIVLYRTSVNHAGFINSFLKLPWMKEFSPFIKKKNRCDIEQLDEFLDFILKE